jgi:hypothetical protein
MAESRGEQRRKVPLDKKEKEVMNSEDRVLKDEDESLIKDDVSFIEYIADAAAETVRFVDKEDKKETKEAAVQRDRQSQEIQNKLPEDKDEKKKDKDEIRREIVIKNKLTEARKKTDIALTKKIKKFLDVNRNKLTDEYKIFITSFIETNELPIFETIFRNLKESKQNNKENTKILKNLFEALDFKEEVPIQQREIISILQAYQNRKRRNEQSVDLDLFIDILKKTLYYTDNSDRLYDDILKFRGKELNLSKDSKTFNNICKTFDECLLKLLPPKNKLIFNKLEEYRKNSAHSYGLFTTPLKTEEFIKLLMLTPLDFWNKTLTDEIKKITKERAEDSNKMKVLSREDIGYFKCLTQCQALISKQEVKEEDNIKNHVEKHTR